MQKFSTLTDAIELAKFAHRSQTDSAGLPYIEHPMRVLKKVQAQGALPYVQIAAVLHDVTEDSKFTPQMLRDLGFPEPAVEIIKLVDRKYSEILFVDGLPPNTLRVIKETNTFKSLAAEYYYREISRNPGAKMVKNADMDDNTEPWRLSYFSQERQDYLLAKYEKGRRLINAV